MTDFDIKLTQLANRGAKKAQLKARRAGVPVCYAINGALIYQMPDGRIKPVVKKIK